jgi:hypothetical protein
MAAGAESALHAFSRLTQAKENPFSTRQSRLSEGLPYPLGATWDGLGVNFALFSANAIKVELCLFDEGGRREVERITLPEYTDEVWHGHGLRLSRAARLDGMPGSRHIAFSDSASASLPQMIGARERCRAYRAKARPCDDVLQPAPWSAQGVQVLNLRTGGARPPDACS